MSLRANRLGLLPSAGARAFTNDSAACTDSVITSPSLPVVRTWPLPDAVTASIVSNSPPTSVHASPVTAPTWSSRSPIPWRNFRTPANSERLSGVTVTLSALPRSEEHTSELQSLMRISYAVFCLQKKKNHETHIEKTSRH